MTISSDYYSKNLNYFVRLILKLVNCSKKKIKRNFNQNGIKTTIFPNAPYKIFN